MDALAPPKTPKRGAQQTPQRTPGRHQTQNEPANRNNRLHGETAKLQSDRLLVPTLSPGDIVIMDNLGSHKRPGVRAAIQAAGAKLFYLPPYSPDFNPIENAFSKLKALLRKAAERTMEGLWNVIGEALPAFTPKECANFFAAAGYDLD